MNLSVISKLALIMILSLVTCAWPCLSNNWTISCNEEERKGLMKFKQSLQDPKNVLSSWKGNDCCRWSGVTCHNVTGRVIKLELQETRFPVDNWLGLDTQTYYYEEDKVKPFGASEINSGLVSLRYLSHLDLSAIWYVNTTVVPEFFASMKRLRHLRLQAGVDNSCTYGRCDDIDGHLGNDTSVLCCGYSSGKLVVGNVPWLSHLQALRSLEMNGVDLQRPFEFIRVLHQLPSLSVLGLSACNLHNFHLSHFNSTFLARIQHLDLSSNYLSSPIPSAFGNMTSLQYLDLSQNSFNKSIPVWFGNPESLIHIDLHHNDIDNVGQVLLSLLENNRHVKSLILGCEWNLQTDLPFHDNTSESIGDDVELLDLSNCNISGALPSWIGDLKKLRYLLLSRNSFVGSIPTLPNLKDLDLSFNDLGEVNLTSLKRLRSLESLHLAGNMLKGNMLELLFDSSEPLVKLKILDLSSNQLEGPIPPTIFKLAALESLWIDNNNLKGSIPVSLGTLPNMKVMSFSNNRLEGTIPKSLGQLRALRFLDISSNFLNGKIPETIGQLANLVELILYNNSLDGMVFEAHFSNLSKLEVLNIGLNKLTFNISSDWFPPFQLKSILLESCKFETKFPEWIKTQKNAIHLVLSNAHILGPIPKWLNNMQFSYLDLSNNCITGYLSNILPHLKHLDLSNNSISECLPPDISKKIPSIQGLYLTSNLINGPLPASLCDLKNLWEIDLSRNNLTGDFPDCWSNRSSFYIINFSSNKLSGNMPKSIGQLSRLWSLHLNNNSLKGQLPKDLQNCASLEILDLGDNNLSGNLPSWIGTNLGGLQILRLRGNKFYGSIPLQFCSLFQLQILDLSINNLIGNIPSCLQYISGMKRGVYTKMEPTEVWRKEHVVEVIKGRYLEYIGNTQFVVNLDLSSNNLVGSIPGELFSLSGLLGLNLSHNNLSGSITNNIKDMISLESLDLSNNQLSGPIPREMSFLSALSHLNFANNNLSGQVPQGDQLQTIYTDDPFIYDGNPLLCGDPLPRKCNEADEPRARKTKYLKGRKELITNEAILFMITAFGYATGFWGVILLLILKKSWRTAYFKFADETWNKMYVAIAVKLAKIHEKGQG